MGILAKETTPQHSYLALLRKSYGARLDAFRELMRKGLRLKATPEQSVIYLKPQKHWDQSDWEPMTKEVFDAFELATNGVQVTRVA